MNTFYCETSPTVTHLFSLFFPNFLVRTVLRSGELSQYTYLLTVAAGSSSHRSDSGRVRAVLSLRPQPGAASCFPFRKGPGPSTFQKSAARSGSCDLMRHRAGPVALPALSPSALLCARGAGRPRAPARPLVLTVTLFPGRGE